MCLIFSTHLSMGFESVFAFTVCQQSKLFVLTLFLFCFLHLYRVPAKWRYCSFAYNGLGLVPISSANDLDAVTKTLLCAHKQHIYFSLYQNENGSKFFQHFNFPTDIITFSLLATFQHIHPYTFIADGRYISGGHPVFLSEHFVSVFIYIFIFFTYDYNLPHYTQNKNQIHLSLEIDV